MWSRSASSDLPLYKQVIKLIEDNIASGALAPSERLPAERTLSQYLEVNRTTVVRALSELEDRGVLIRRRGSGTYVNSEKWGVQSYATLNWQGPSALMPTKKEVVFRQAAANMREEAVRSKMRFDDLSGDDIAPDLLPRVVLPHGAWEEAIRAEQGSVADCLGLPSLRQSVQRFLRETSGLSVPLEEILITSGSRQAIFLITQCLLRPGDAVGVEAPSYFYSLPIFQAAGLRLFALPMDDNGITPQGLEEVARRRSLKMIFLNPVFHNPTGKVMRDTRKKAVLELCAKMRLPIVEDDAYSLLSFGAPRDLSPIKAWDAQNQVMYAGSLSSYAGRGIRAGWLVAPQSVIRRLADVRLMMDAGLSVLPQVLAKEYLDREVAAHLQELRTALALRAEKLTAHVRRIFGSQLVSTPPPGGLYCYVSMRESEDAAYECMQQEFLRNGILPALGESFGDPEKSFRLNHSLFIG